MGIAHCKLLKKSPLHFHLVNKNQNHQSVLAECFLLVEQQCLADALLEIFSFFNQILFYGITGVLKQNFVSVSKGWKNSQKSRRPKSVQIINQIGKRLLPSFLFLLHFPQWRQRRTDKWLNGWSVSCADGRFWFKPNGYEGECAPQKISLGHKFKKASGPTLKYLVAHQCKSSLRDKDSERGIQRGLVCLQWAVGILVETSFLNKQNRPRDNENDQVTRTLYTPGLLIPCPKVIPQKARPAHGKLEQTAEGRAYGGNCSCVCSGQGWQFVFLERTRLST